MQLLCCHCWCHLSPPRIERTIEYLHMHFEAYRPGLIYLRWGNHWGLHSGPLFNQVWGPSDLSTSGRHHSCPSRHSLWIQRCQALHSQPKLQLVLGPLFPLPETFPCWWLSRPRFYVRLGRAWGQTHKRVHPHAILREELFGSGASAAETSEDFARLGQISLRLEHRPGP